MLRPIDALSLISFILPPFHMNVIDVGEPTVMVTGYVNSCSPALAGKRFMISSRCTVRMLS